MLVGMLFLMPLHIFAHPDVEQIEIITKYPNGTHIHHIQTEPPIRQYACDTNSCIIGILIVVIITVMLIVTVLVYRKNIFPNM